MAPKTLLKVCGDFVRDQTTGLREPCKKEYSGDECPRRRTDHIRPMKTGYCGSGWCEGMKPKSYSGQPCPTCKFWLVCPCDCHELVSLMFFQSEMPRRLVDNPEYHPVKITGLMTAEERAKLHAERKAEDRTARAVQSAATDGGDEIHSPSGRTRKGLLDTWMEQVCKIWAVDTSRPCTPSWISECIGMCFDVTPPSVGAIDAVLKRWVDYDFAYVEKKPTRFTGFTAEGQRLGLDVMREKSKLSSNKWVAPPPLVRR